MTDVELERRQAAYVAACRASNTSLGQASRDEIIDLVNVRDAAYAYIHELERLVNCRDIDVRSTHA